MRSRLALAFAAALCCAAQEPARWSLPESVRPLRHQVQLTIDPAQSEFHGRIAIDVELLQRTREVRLNALGLVVHQARWISAGHSSVLVWHAAPNEQIAFALPASEGPGRARIEIEYSGTISSSLTQGPYRRKQSGRWYVFTTFTPIDARRAFPCFDEPGIKAAWQLTLLVPDKLVAASNTPILEEQRESANWKMVRFAETAPLPAEVIAFTVGPYDVAEGLAAGEKMIPVCVLAPHGHAAEAKAAAAATDEVLRRVEAYMGTPYPWAKLDFVALPAGTFGAVENPGLITFRGSILLGSAANREWLRDMRAVMAHELVHQWFGNLVTQAAWDDVYLSEGFATWLGKKTSDADQPPDHLGLSLVEGRNASMKADEDSRARPVRLDLRSRRQLADVYNGVVYQKAASVLRMLEVYLGQEPMRRATRRYLKDHAGKTATTGDLVQAIQEETGQDTGPILNAFLNRVGVPIVTLRLDCTSAAKPSIALRQSSQQAGASAALWPVPVCVRTASGQSCTLLETEHGTLALKDPACPAWIVPNAAGAGYYRTRVEGPGLDKAQLNSAERAAWNADQ